MTTSATASASVTIVQHIIPVSQTDTVLLVDDGQIQTDVERQRQRVTDLGNYLVDARMKSLKFSIINYLQHTLHHHHHHQQQQQQQQLCITSWTFGLCYMALNYGFKRSLILVALYRCSLAAVHVWQPSTTLTLL